MTATKDSTFKDAIENLDITLGQSSDGLYTVCSLTEPLFCFDGHSIEEVQAEVEDTLRSYARIFYGIDVQLHTNILNVDTVPIERVRPIGRVNPVLEAA